MHPEKNFVNISKLFDWGRTFTINTPSGEPLDIFMRVVGDADINKARVFALRKSAELRAKLRNKDSDENLAFIPLKEDMDKNKLVELLTLYNVKEVNKDVYKAIDVPFPKELGPDASLEEQEKYQLQIDGYDALRKDAISKEIEKRTSNLEKLISKKPLEELYRNLVDYLVNELCEQEMVRKYNEFCVYSGCYMDEGHKTRLFQNYGEFDSLPSEIKNKLENEYYSIEINMDELKK